MIGLNHVVLHVASDAVLWSKQGAKLYVPMLVKQVCGMPEPMIHGCLVAD
jgi:hypothetical protein